MGTHFWMDEGLSIGIARHALFDIPGVLRQDGSPPLYYMLLHVWMDVVGDGEAATHALSLVFALLTIPGRAVGRLEPVRPARRADLRRALRASTRSSRATRRRRACTRSMRPARLLATAAFLHASSTAAARYLPRSSLVLALMLYTHNWGLFLGAGLALALIPCWYVRERPRELLRDALIGFGGAGAALPAVGADAALPGAAHRRAVAQPAPLRRAGPDRASRCSAAARRTVALVLAGGSGDRGASLGAARASDRERTALLAGGLIVLGDARASPGWSRRSRRRGRPLPRRRCSARCCCSPRSASRAPARSGSSALAIIVGHLGDPDALRPRATRANARDLARDRPCRAAHGRPRALDAARAGPAAARTTCEQARRCADAALGARSASKDRGSWTGRDALDKLQDAPPPSATLAQPLLASLPPGGRGPHRAPGHLTGERLGRAPGPSWCGAARPSGARRSRATRASSVYQLVPPVTTGGPRRIAGTWRALREDRTNEPTSPVDRRSRRRIAADHAPNAAVVVLGGGPAGLTAGYLLAKRGCP